MKYLTSHNLIVYFNLSKIFKTKISKIEQLSISIVNKIKSLQLIKLVL